MLISKLFSPVLVNWNYIILHSMQLFVYITHRLMHAHHEFLADLFFIGLIVGSSWLYFASLRIKMGKEIEILFTSTLTRYLPELVDTTPSSNSVRNWSIIGGHDSSILLVLMVRGFSFTKNLALVVTGTKFAIIFNQLINLSTRKHCWLLGIIRLNSLKVILKGFTGLWIVRFRSLLDICRKSCTTFELLVHLMAVE